MTDMSVHFQALVVCAYGVETTNKTLSVKKQFTGEKVTDLNNFYLPIFYQGIVYSRNQY